MKKLFIITILMLGCCVSAQDYGDNIKCTDLMSEMYAKRAALFNALNLSKEQQGYKDKTDKCYQDKFAIIYEEYNKEIFVLHNMEKHNASSQALNKQRKVVKNIAKQMHQLNKKYDSEYKSILNSNQYDKLKEIRKMEKSTLKYCKKDKAFYKRDANLRPFGCN